MMRLGIAFLMLLKGAVAVRTAGASSLYVFDAEQCPMNSFTESSSTLFGNFTRGSATSCLAVNGVGLTTATRDPSAQMISTNNASSFKTQLAGATGLTIELWLKHGTSNSSIAQNILSDSSVDANVGSCSEGSDFEVIRVNNRHGLNLRAYNISGMQCTTIVDPNATSIVNGEGPVHVVFTLNFLTQVVRIVRQGGLLNLQGGSNKRMASPGLNLTSSVIHDYWNSSYHLQAFANARSMRSHALDSDIAIAPWVGELNLVAFYSRVLNDSEIYANYRAGLTNSPPAVFDANITIPEDGEVGNHSTPSYYLTEVPFSDLITISLPAPYDAELDSTKTNQYDPATRPPLVYVSTLPQSDRGTLYLMDGSVLSTLPYLLAAPYSMKFRPAKDQYSSTFDTPFAAFTYYAIDGETSKRCAKDATVNLFVSRKNDPPLPANGTYVVQAGSEYRLVCVNGTDIDEGDSAVSGRVITLPHLGYLYAVSDGASVGTILAANDSFGNGQLCAAYRYTASETTAIDGYVATDNFTFAVEDKTGSISTAGTAVLRVRSSIGTSGAYFATLSCLKHVLLESIDF
jgi:hypothetical protein